TTSYPAPYGNYYYGAKHQLFVTAAELTTAGITPAVISAIGFDVYATNSTGHVNFTVKIYTTTATDPLSTAYHTSGLVATSAPSNYLPTNGWNMHAVTPFSWWGTENIVIETCFNNTGWTN